MVREQQKSHPDNEKTIGNEVGERTTDCEENVRIITENLLCNPPAGGVSRAVLEKP